MRWVLRWIEGVDGDRRHRYSRLETFLDNVNLYKSKDFNPGAVYDFLMDELNKNNISYEVHNFDSGAKMIDIWHNDLFYVVQIDNELVGISPIDENTAFDNIPDISFFDIESFAIKLKSVIG